MGFSHYHLPYGDTAPVQRRTHKAEAGVQRQAEEDNQQDGTAQAYSSSESNHQAEAGTDCC
jgi:hypothetical protein